MLFKDASALVSEVAVPSLRSVLSSMLRISLSTDVFKSFENAYWCSRACLLYVLQEKVLDFNNNENTIRGTVKKIYFEKRETGYKAVLVSGEEDDDTVVGKMPDVSVGDTIEVTGTYADHPKFGIQFKASSYRIIPPSDSQAMEKYLASGAVAGVGEKLAARIVAKFGDDTFRIIEEEPERLSEIKGISKRKAMVIAVAM